MYQIKKIFCSAGDESYFFCNFSFWLEWTQLFDGISNYQARKRLSGLQYEYIPFKWPIKCVQNIKQIIHYALWLHSRVNELEDCSDLTDAPVVKNMHIGLLGKKHTHTHRGFDHHFQGHPRL